MRYLQVNIEDLDKWRSIEKNIPRSLPVIKTYDISLHTLDTSECQELASIFEERARQNLAGMMGLYNKSIYDAKYTFNVMRSTLKMNIWFLFPSSKSSKIDIKGSRRRFKQRNSYPRKILKNL